MISVLIPTYLRPHLLAQAEASVRMQAGVGAVDLVVEPDSTASGQSATVNRAWARAQGEYVLVLDDDDYLVRRDALALLRGTLDAYPAAAAAYSMPRYVDAWGGEAVTPVRVLGWAREHPVVDAAAVARDGFLMHGGGILYRRAWWERAGPWDETLPVCQEWEYRLRMLALGATYALCPHVTVAYRQHKGQMSARGGRMGRRSVAANAVRQAIAARYALQAAS